DGCAGRAAAVHHPVTAGGCGAGLVSRCGHSSGADGLGVVEQFQVVLFAEHAGRVDGGRLSEGGVGAVGEQGVHHGVFVFEHGPGEWGLTAVVEPVDVGPVSAQALHRVGVTVVGGQHHEGVALVVGEVGGNSSANV